MSRRKIPELSKQQIKLAEYMRMNGATQKEIATELNVSEGTYNKHYKKYIVSATNKRHAFVGGKLYDAIKKGDVTAIIFYLKTQCRWKDRDLYKIKKLEVDIKKQSLKATEKASQEPLRVVVEVEDE